MTIAMLPCPAALETIASRVGANFSSCQRAELGALPAGRFRRRHVVGIVVLEVHARSPSDRDARIAPAACRRRSAPAASATADPIAAWPVRCDTISASAITSGLNAMPTSEPVATKPSARPRIRGGYMSVAATRSCCAALTPMVNSTMPATSPDALCASMAKPVSKAAHHRQPLPEQDAGLAAELVGDLAGRIGHQEAADAEQPDRRARRGSPSRSPRCTISGPMP